VIDNVFDGLTVVALGLLAVVIVWDLFRAAAKSLRKNE
jgi:hypothetical protein